MFLYYDRIMVSHEIDVIKTRESNECDIQHYWDILDKWFKFHLDVCMSCHTVLIMSMKLSDIALLDNRYVISGISKSEAINLMQDIDLTEKSETL